MYLKYVSSMNGSSLCLCVGISACVQLLPEKSDLFVDLGGIKVTMGLSGQVDDESHTLT